ncbi:ABC transporter permease [Cetobacterium sp. 2A]|uniref:ABC transporter permease n=1 Tax=unclassified Cetobacterium TaxID=2630983 RepID=UPI00163BBF2E|nr:ABC transporter permease [Cetobacterium sp. 2A]MBC2857163.1 ABC transporter permease [Cetobacterium sp. 2A]
MGFILKLFHLYKDRSDFFIELFIQHVILSFTAIIVITVLGISSGIYMTRHKNIANILFGIMNFIYTIPSIALLGFLVVITGIGNGSALIALVLYGLLPMIRNTYVGITEVDQIIIESAVAMGSTSRQLLLKIQIPIALPIILAGFRIMVVMTIALTGIASFIGAGGLGVAIWRGITTNYPEMTVAGSLLVALFAVVMDLIIGIFEKKYNKRITGDKKMEVLDIV